MPFFKLMFMGPLVPLFTIVVLIGIWLKSKRLERKEVKGLESVCGSKRCVEYESGSSLVKLSGVLLSTSSYQDMSDSVSDVGADVGARKVLPSRDIVVLSVRSH